MARIRESPPRTWNPRERVTDGGQDQTSWLRAKLRNYYPHPPSHSVERLERAVTRGCTADAAPLFDNPFTIADVAVLDDETLRDVLAGGAHGLAPEDVALALRDAPGELVGRVRAALPHRERARFDLARTRRATSDDARAARRRLLDALFWELTYWKTPELYEALTEGERLHPGIFRRLGPLLRGKVVLDAGAGSGRATLACLQQGARHVYAVEPSPGLLRILERKVGQSPAMQRITPVRGRFDALPLPDGAVDVAISCSAFTADPEQGGEAGLAELRRVTRAGGRIVVIWPRPEDYGWLAEHGFSYVALPMPKTMRVRYRSLRMALRVARRFYAHNSSVLRYLQRHHRPEVPFSLLGDNPPHDYCWLRVERAPSSAGAQAASRS